MAKMRASGESPGKGSGFGSGRNKARAKKRDYQAHCRAMRKAGQVTDANGSWVPAQNEAIRKMTCAK